MAYTLAIECHPSRVKTYMWIKYFPSFALAFVRISIPTALYNKVVEDITVGDHVNIIRNI